MLNHFVAFPHPAIYTFFQNASLTKGDGVEVLEVEEYQLTI